MSFSFFNFFNFLNFFKFEPTYKPLPKQLWKIELEPYRFPENCCAHKAAKYAKLLNAAVIRANVVVGTVRDSPPHAWVHVVHPKKNTIHMIDPTWSENRDGLKIDKYPHRKAQFKFKEGVTGHEVFIYKGIIKIKYIVK